MTTLRFGVNYVPRSGWFYSWLEPDWDEIRRDLRSIASIGLDHVRVFPFWPILQPNRTLIRPRALADVRRLVEIAGEEGLDASVDVIQGHMSSYDFVPAWLTSWHTTNMFTDEGALTAQEQLARAVHDAVADLDNYIGLTLGNEVNQFSGDPHPHPMRATSAEAETWLRRLTDAVPATEGRIRLHSEYDAAWYLDGHPFLPAHASRIGDVAAVHSWVFNGTAQRYGGMSNESVRHAEYLTELASAFATGREHPVWLQEVGAPSNCLTAEEAPDFCTQTVLNAAENPSLWGVTWWCSHDVDESLSDFPELEYSLGLFDAQGELKPVGRAFAEVVRQLRERAEAPAPRTVAVVIDVDEELTPISRATLAPGGSVFSTWMRLAEQGLRPALVTSQTAADEADLAARGVTELVQPTGGGKSAYSAVSDEDALLGENA